MSNKDLLKQAIAEAKTIREAAIANAKEALEETLTPHLKDMLAAKLQEMEDKEDEKVVDENIYEAEEEEGPEEETEESEEEESEEEEAGEEVGEEEEEEMEIEDMSVEDLKDLIRGIVAQETGAGEEEGEEYVDGMEAPEGEDMTGMDSEEEIDINELLAELEGEEEEPIEEWGGGAAAGTPGRDTGNELDTKLIDTIKSLAAKTGKSYDAISQFLYGGKKLTPSEFEEGVQVKEDLQEALKAVKILKNQLQEVNLLNAKLLYVNKVFKASNLSEGQKVNVIAAFDKAETVREVKLVFETVSKNVVAKPAAIKEHRSFASKATGVSTAPKEIISEVSEQVARWQKLAGIIKS